MYCLDTNIIIFALKDKQNKVLNNRIASELSQGNLATNSVVVWELLYYSYKHKATKSLELRQKFLNLLNIFDFDFESANLASKYKSQLELSGQKTEDFDLMIASICLANDLILVTANTKHFENIEGLKVENWS